MKLILNAFSLYFVIGHSLPVRVRTQTGVFDIGYSSLKLIAMPLSPLTMDY